MVGFPDFIYKHIVPACFLAPLKPTFDLADAQTVLVSLCCRSDQQSEAGRVRDGWLCLPDAGRVCSHAEDHPPEEGKAAGGARPPPSSCLTLLFLLQGPEFIQFLQQDYLPSLQVSPEISQVTMETQLHRWPR